jgi:hypothetical protein
MYVRNGVKTYNTQINLCHKDLGVKQAKLVLFANCDFISLQHLEIKFAKLLYTKLLMDFFFGLLLMNVCLLNLTSHWAH